MKKASLGVGYHLSQVDLSALGERLTTVGTIFNEIKDRYHLEGEARQTQPNTLLIRLAQEPQIVGAALEDLINSEIGVPDVVYPVVAVWPWEWREGKRGFKIAQEVLGSAGYLLKADRDLLSFNIIIFHYDVVKKES